MEQWWPLIALPVAALIASAFIILSDRARIARAHKAEAIRRDQLSQVNW